MKNFGRKTQIFCQNYKIFITVSEMPYLLRLFTNKDHVTGVLSALPKNMFSFVPRPIGQAFSTEADDKSVVAN